MFVHHAAASVPLSLWPGATAHTFFVRRTNKQDGIASRDTDANDDANEEKTRHRNLVLEVEYDDTDRTAHILVCLHECGKQ